MHRARRSAPVRRPQGYVRPPPVRLPQGYVRPPPANSSAFSLAPTTLPRALIPATKPPKIPTRPLSGHPLGTLLSIPTFGPLPTVPPPTITRATIVPPRSAVPPRLIGSAPAVVPGRPYGGGPVVASAPGARARRRHHRGAPVHRR